MVAPALPVPVLGNWTLRPTADRARDTYTVSLNGAPVTRLELRRVAHDRLRNCYPYGSRDIALSLTPLEPRAEIAELLQELVPALFAADPRCRRVIAAPAEADAAALAAYEAGGLHRVAEADLPGGSVVLCTAEPPQIAGLSTSLDDMPH